MRTPPARFMRSRVAPHVVSYLMDREPGKAVPFRDGLVAPVRLPLILHPIASHGVSPAGDGALYAVISAMKGSEAQTRGGSFQIPRNTKAAADALELREVRGAPGSAAVLGSTEPSSASHNAHFAASHRAHAL